MSESSCGKCEPNGCTSPIHHKKFHYVIRDLGRVSFERTTKASIVEEIERITLENTYDIRTEQECPDPLKARFVYVVDLNSRNMAALSEIYYKLGKMLSDSLFNVLVQNNNVELEVEGVDSAIMWREVPDTHPASSVIKQIQAIIDEHGHPVSSMGKLGGVEMGENLKRLQTILGNKGPLSHENLRDLEAGRALLSEGEKAEKLVEDPVKVSDDDDKESIH